MSRGRLAWTSSPDTSLYSPDAMFEIEAIAVVDDAVEWADQA
jgi:hypothetical protein